MTAHPDSKLQPNPGLEYLTPDELAECVSGISQPTYLRLWEILGELEREGKQAPIGGDRHDPTGEFGYPMVEDPYSYRDVVSSGQGNVTSIWSRLSREQQLEINAAMEARDAEWDRVMEADRVAYEAEKGGS